MEVPFPSIRRFYSTATRFDSVPAMSCPSWAARPRLPVVSYCHRPPSRFLRFPKLATVCAGELMKELLHW